MNMRTLLLAALLVPGMAWGQVQFPPALPKAGGTMTGNIGLGNGTLTYGSFGPSPTGGGTMLVKAGTDQYYDNTERVENPSKLYWQQNISCTFTSGSAVVTGCPATTGASVNNFLTGAAVPAGATIASGLTGTGFTMSANATASGSQAVSIVRQCGNAAFNFGTQSNGLTGDGYEMGAFGISNPGDSCQGFYNGKRTGAAGGTIGYGTLYTEASYLMPAGAGKYMDVATVITHNANADYYANASWKPFWVNGQSGDMQFSDHSGASMLSMTELTKAATFGGALSVSGSLTAGAGLANNFAITGGLAGNPIAITAQGTDGSILVRVDDKGGAGVALASRANYALLAQNPASAVDYLKAYGAATTGTVGFSALGSDTTIPFRLDDKGGVGITLGSNGNASVIALNSSASAVNYLQLAGSGAGAPVSIAAKGTDGSILVRVDDKGGAGVALGSQGAYALLAANPGGSPVNYWRANGSLATQPVWMQALGSDSNIDARIQPKGTGMLDIYGTAVTAATSAPAFSATSRIQIKINGTAFWIPASAAW